ncbi:MAG: STAS/SEC14 domain-containing protein [bacterium]|nr:STAS/SEC14 domain-containing protein [bacterium]
MSEGIEIQSVGSYLHVKVTGKLTKESYEVFTPAIDGQIKQYGKIRILFEMHDFHGWTAGALWEDIKFDFSHWGDIEKLAIVGESKWEQGMATFCKPFTSAKIQYFDHQKLDEARAWIES